MDIPVFHLDFLNNRALVAIAAILHVVINHSMAVGGIRLVALLERRAWVRGDAAADRIARRVLAVFFVVTTTLGAMSGVGIWFSTAMAALGEPKLRAIAEYMLETRAKARGRQ